MGEPAIRVEGLGKRYRLAHGQERSSYRTLRESMMGFIANPFKGKGRIEEFWALNDVSFEVQPGEVVGIIGRNGAGKSTLLKVLSRITKPTTGRVEINGRVGSLLEVGTGFHPELTGRENIYLNGSILGMSHAEITKKFDEIVAFAEVEKFLDTPVKRYSSGMYVRLAFAVAAYLEPEILIVDEVLAVGDASFQRKCITRMTELSASGRSLLFVSHNLELLPRFCHRAVFLERGQVKMAGPVSTVLGAYTQQLVSSSSEHNLVDRPRRGSGTARFVRIRFLDQNGCETNVLRTGDDFRCVVDIEATRPLRDVSLAVVIKTVHGSRIFSSWTEEVGYFANLTPGRQSFECRFADVRVRPGRQVVVELWMHDGSIVDHLDDAYVLDVIESGPSTFSTRADQGVVLYDYCWHDYHD